MRIGISAFAWTAQFNESHLRLLPRIKELGLSAFEVPMFDPDKLPAEKIRNAFAEHGLECTVCAILPPGVNPISPEAVERQRAVAHLTQCVQAAHKLGASLLGGPLFSPIGYLPNHRPSGEEWGWAIETFQALAGVLDATGVTLAIEPVNRSETFFLRTAEEARRLVEAVGNPQIGVTIDTFHANIEEKSVAAAISSLGSHLKHIHASENDRGPLGRGHVPFAEIISALKVIRYDGYLMIEGFGYDPVEKIGPGVLWAEMDVSPEQLAVESTNYLRGLLA